MERAENQITVTSVPETAECDSLKKKDGKFLILESRNEVSTAKDFFKLLRSGLRSNCNIQNRPHIEDKLKNLVLRLFPDSEITLNDSDDDNAACVATTTQTKEDIMQILERSRQLNKENVQIIDGVEVLLSGQGGRPFARLEKDKTQKDHQAKEFEPEQRVQIIQKLDELLISTLKCTVEASQLSQMNASANINHYPNSSLSRNIREMGDLITDLYTNSLKGTQTTSVDVDTRKPRLAK